MRYRRVPLFRWQNWLSWSFVPLSWSDLSGCLVPLTCRVSLAKPFVWPTPLRGGAAPDDPNQRATVAIVSEGGFSLLLSADAESPVLLPLRLPRVDAIKVPHHGSADPGLPDLLDRLRPRVAGIEVGRGNDYGHPTPSTLDALRARVPLVYRTDRDGTVELTVHGGRIEVRTHR